MKYDFCILGAGLAGLTLAKNLSEISNTKILVIDPNGIGGGASGSPIGLVNPATGRFATKTWRAEEAVEAIKDNLETVSISQSEKFYSKDGVIRPALDAKIARRMKENMETTHWPSGWCTWMEENEITHRFPELNCVDGGVWVAAGITVAIPKYLDALAKYIQAHGVDIIERHYFKQENESSLIDININDENNGWHIKLDDDSRIEANHLIVTAGIMSKEFDFWKDLPLHPVKGQVAIFKCLEEFPYDSAVSALGYFASLDSKIFVAGSTYEHNFDHNEIDKKGLKYIQDRMLKVMPNLKDKFELVDQWSGVRASTPDRMPIIGHHPTIKNCSVFAGLGSKGLLYSALLGKELAQHLINSGKLSEEVSITRFLSNSSF